MENSSQPNKFYITVGIITIFVLFSIIMYILYDIVKEKQKYIDMYKQSQSELQVIKNKDGTETAKNESISGVDIKDFVNAIFKDSAMIELQQLVKENNRNIKKGGSATNFGTQTTIDKSSTTYVTYENDSFPIYTSNYKDKWIDYTILASKDSIKLNQKIFNKYSLVVGREKVKVDGKLFKQWKPYSYVTNHNPYTSTETLKSYQVELDKPKRLGLGVNLGYSLTPVGLLPSIGIGLNYNVIELK